MVTIIYPRCYTSIIQLFNSLNVPSTRHFSNNLYKKSWHPSQDDIISLCKRRGFVFQSSEIYGGLASVYDYGPLGSMLKRNLRESWWRKFVTSRSDVIPFESSVLMHSNVWKASGHLDNFVDPLFECRQCHNRTRADSYLSKALQSLLDGDASEKSLASLNIPSHVIAKVGKNFDLSSLSAEDLTSCLKYLSLVPSADLRCPNLSCCAPASDSFTDARQFNLLFSTKCGPVGDSSSSVFLRPETAQGIFVNFMNIYQSHRCRLPFGVAQIGRSFRNEISPGQFIFRTREFEQAEIEYFCEPGNAREIYETFVSDAENWLLCPTSGLGISKSSLRRLSSNRQAGDLGLAHYALATTDLEFRFPFGWGELWGICWRGDFDLSCHSEHSKRDMRVSNSVDDSLFFPHVVEPSLGIDRLMMAVLADSLDEDVIDGEPRRVLRLSPSIAPVTAAVLPLSKKDPLLEISNRIYKSLRKFGISSEHDITQSIGRRYRRQDEIGTPFCVTVDFDSLKDEMITLRARDSTRQCRIGISDLLTNAESLKFTLFIQWLQQQIK